MNGMCGIDLDRGPLARSIRSTFKPSPLDWAKKSRAVGPLMRRLTEPRFPPKTRKIRLSKQSTETIHHLSPGIEGTWVTKYREVHEILFWKMNLTAHGNIHNDLI